MVLSSFFPLMPRWTHLEFKNQIHAQHWSTHSPLDHETLSIHNHIGLYVNFLSICKRWQTSYIDEFGTYFFHYFMMKPRLNIWTKLQEEVTFHMHRWGWYLCWVGITALWYQIGTGIEGSPKFWYHMHNAIKAFSNMVHMVWYM